MVARSASAKLTTEARLHPASRSSALRGHHAEGNSSVVVVDGVEGRSLTRFSGIETALAAAK
jgi:hypothetical protein